MENKKVNIQDYLHLYLGCDCMIGDITWKPETNLHGLAPNVDVNYGKPIKTKVDAHVLSVFSHKTTLILRQLSSMTEDEKLEIQNICGWLNYNSYLDIGLTTPQVTVYLLSKGFDLFGLIKSGLAIDSTLVASTPKD